MMIMMIIIMTVMIIYVMVHVHGLVTFIISIGCKQDGMMPSFKTALLILFIKLHHDGIISVPTLYVRLLWRGLSLYQENGIFSELFR